jgi:hypothetical protein
VLFELIGSRYERRSLLITANQPFGEWGKVFPDQAMTLAAVDRLVHHATILEMNVESYRRRAAINRKRGPGRPPSHATINREPDCRAAKNRQPKVRTWTSFTYQAGSWRRPRKVVARLECSLQPDAGETTSKGMRQEVDIRYVVTSLKARQSIFMRTSTAGAGRWRTSSSCTRRNRRQTHVVSQRDGQSGAARIPHRCVLVDARRARRHSTDRPARKG